MLNLEIFRELMAEKSIKGIMELSRQAKIPYTTLLYMLNGHDMHVSTLVELAKFFGVPVDYLINKSYGILVCTENDCRFFETTSFLEASELANWYL